MSTVVRNFRDSDSSVLWSIFYAAIHQTASAHYTPEQLDAWAPREFDRARWHQRVRDLSPFVVERDGIAVAYADLQPDGYIDHFFVSPEVARQGVGTLLMEAIHRSASAEGLTLLFAHVSLTARPFFEKWGFTVDEERSLNVGGVALRNFRMSKALAQRDSS